MTLTWRVAGISKESNEGVQGFFDKYWDMRMDTIENTYNDLLGKPGR